MLSKEVATVILLGLTLSESKLQNPIDAWTTLVESFYLTFYTPWVSRHLRIPNIPQTNYSQEKLQYHKSAQLGQVNSAINYTESTWVNQAIAGLWPYNLGQLVHTGFLHQSYVHKWHVYIVNKYGTTPQWNLVLSCFLPSTFWVNLDRVAPSVRYTIKDYSLFFRGEGEGPMRISNKNPIWTLLLEPVVFCQQFFTPMLISIFVHE